MEGAWRSAIENRDEVIILSANTGQVLHTLSIPGIREAPAWFGDARHIAVPTQLPTGRSAMALWDAVSGSLRREAAKDVAQVRFRYETRLDGRLIYRETREGVDRWLAPHYHGRDRGRACSAPAAGSSLTAQARRPARGSVACLHP